MLRPQRHPHLPDLTRSLPESATLENSSRQLVDLRASAHELLRARDARDEALVEMLPGAWLARAYSAQVPAPALYRPALGAVLQGAKRVLVGDSVLDYHEGEALLTQRPVPARGMVIAAERHAPFLGLVIELEPALIRELLTDMGEVTTGTLPAPAPFSVTPLHATVLACLQRVVTLASDNTSAQHILWPAFQRELVFRLLQSPVGPALKSMARPQPIARRMERAIRSIQRGFRQSLDTATLASNAGMSATLFYRNFRDATGLSPLQYQKQLRLLEARRLLQRGGSSIAATAYAVGYESPSQFSREFGRLFGHPPRQSLPGTVR